jgi:hypothetical protein
LLLIERNVVDELENTEGKQAAGTPAADDFESAFAEFSGARDASAQDQDADEKAADEKAADTSPAPSEPEGKDSAQENAREKPQDGLKGNGDAPEDLRKRLEDAENRAKELTHKLHSNAGRQSVLQRKNNALQTQLEALTAKSGRPQSAKMTELAGNFPEIADALQEAIESIRGEFHNSVKPLHENEERRVFSSAVEEVRRVHPDFIATINTPEFVEWLQSQPASVQSLADSRDPYDAIAMLGYYGAGKQAPPGSTAPPPASGQPSTAVGDIKSQRSAALQRNLSVRNTSATTISDAPDDFENAFAFYAKRRERQMERSRL